MALHCYLITFEFVACHSRESGNPDCKEVDSASSAESQLTDSIVTEYYSVKFDFVDIVIARRPKADVAIS